MQTAPSRKLRITALLIALLLLSALTAGLIWPGLYDLLPESLLAPFRTSRPPDLKMHSVFGTITFDDEPIQDGEIRFVPLNKDLNPDVAKIKKGKFNGQVKEGEHKVEIRALKEDDTQYIPARYNVNTELRFHAKDGEQNFALYSKTK